MDLILRKSCLFFYDFIKNWGGGGGFSPQSPLCLRPCNYFEGNKAFKNFCLQFGLLGKHGLIFLSEENLMYFTTHCPGVRGLSPSKIHNYLYGIRSWSIYQGLPDPLRTASGQPLLCLARALHGIKKMSSCYYKQNITYHFGNPASFEQTARIILFW